MATSNARFEKVFESSEAMRLKVVESEQLERKRAKDRGDASWCSRVSVRPGLAAEPSVFSSFPLQLLRLNHL